MSEGITTIFSPDQVSRSYVSGFLIVSGESLSPFTKKESSVTVADINTRCAAREYDPKASSGGKYGSISTAVPEKTHWQCASMSRKSGQANFTDLRSVWYDKMEATSLSRSIQAQ